MPQLGETVTEGKITSWYKSVGDAVAAGDNLFEIETDKTSMEVPTTVAGVISEIRVLAGATVPVGSIVAVLAGADGAEKTSPPKEVPAPAPNASSKRVFDPMNAVRSPQKNFGPAAQASGAKATPLARRVAAENHIDVSRAVGSGPHGRVVANDIAALLSADPSPSAARKSAAPSAPAAAGPASAQIKSLYTGVAFDEVPVDGMRRIIARRLVEAKQTIPHFYLTADIELDRLLVLRSEFNAQGGDHERLSINDFVIKAMALALRNVPQANAIWTEDAILRFARSDISVAVAVESGLFTPVVRGADAKPISAISKEMKSLIDRSRSKTLMPAEYQGGSMSISNLGMLGVRSFTAIINPPQSAILAVGAAERRPCEGPGGALRFADMMTVTLSCDHRVIDGALGAQLLASFKGLLQAPLSLLL